MLDHRTRKLTVFVSILFIFTSCGKRVSGPSTIETRALDGSDVRSSIDQNGIPVDVGSAGGDGEGDLESVLRSEIEAEAEARRLADEDLQSQIDELEARVAQLEEDLEKEVEERTAEDLAIRELIGDSSVAEQLAELEERLTAARDQLLADQKKDIEDKIDQHVEALDEADQALISQLNDLRDEIAAERARIDALVLENQTQQTEIDDLEEALADEVARINDLEQGLSDQGERIDDLTQTLIDEVARLDAADVLLQQAIDELEARVDSLELRVDQIDIYIADILLEIAALNDEDEAQAQRIADLEQLVADYRDEQADINAALEARDDELYIYILDLEAEIDRLDETDEAQAIRIGELEDLVAQYRDAQEVVNAAAADERAEIRDDLLALEQRQDEFEEYAAITFATKQDAAQLLALINALTLTVEILDGRVDTVDQRITDTRDDLIDRIEDVEGDVQSIRDDLDAHIQEYWDNMMPMMESCQQAIADLRTEMLTITGDLDDYAQALNDRVSELEAFVAVGGALDDRLDELANDAQAAADDALAAALAESQGNYDELSGLINGLRGDLNDEVAALLDQIEEVRQTANAAHSLAEMNSTKIEAMEQELADARGQYPDLASRLDQMENTIEAGLEEVRAYAEDLVAELGNDVQEQFVTINTTLVNLQQQIDNTASTIINIFIVFTGDMGILEAFDIAQQPINDLVTEKLFDYRTSQARLEEALTQAIDPVLGANGVDINAMNTAFRVIAATDACNGNPGTGDEFSAVKDKEWFFHLARIYARLLTSGVRTGSGAEDVYLGKPSLFVSDDDLRSLMIVGSSAPYALPAGDECNDDVMSWATDALLGWGANSVALRAAIMGSDEVRAAVNDLYAKAGQLTAPIADLIAVVEGLLADVFEDAPDVDAAVAAALYGDDGAAPSIIVQIADLLLERSSLAGAIDEIRANRDRYVDIMRQVATMQDQMNNNTNAITALNANVAALQNAMDDVLNTIPGQVESLFEAARAQFRLYAKLAARLGFQDLVTEARDEALRTIGYVIPPMPGEIPMGAMAATHFYNHSTSANPNGVGATCMGNPTEGTNVLTGNTMTRCAIHANNGTTSRGYTWGNLCEVTNGWYAASVCGWNEGQRVGNGLLLEAREPTDPVIQALAAKPLGSSYNEMGGRGVMILKVFGNADRWRINVRAIDVNNAARTAQLATWYPYDVEVSAADFKVGQDENTLVYHIPLNNATQRLHGCRSDREITITALVEQGDGSYVADGDIVKHRYHTFSPIVLDLAGMGDAFTTVNPLLSKAMFDLDGNGIQERTGWITKGSGLLAIDLDGNGRIDNGSELFGEASRLADGSTAENGYTAMAAYDTNGDRKLDAQDDQYDQLRVWIDRNQDGVSQPYELKRLKDLEITSLDVDYTSVAEDKVVQSHGLAEANLVKYQARYYSPKCGQNGCKTYDVYFGSTETLSLSEK